MASFWSCNIGGSEFGRAGQEKGLTLLAPDRGHHCFYAKDVERPSQIVAVIAAAAADSARLQARRCADGARTQAAPLGRVNNSVLWDDLESLHSSS
jgi:hypothetical protein